MATISSLGVGTNGLDTNSIVQKLVELEKTPLKTLEAKATSIQAQIGGLAQIKSLFSTLESAASKLSSLTGWNSVTTTSSNSDAVSATAIGGTLPTNFNVEVQQLAESQSFASAKLGKDALVGAGTLKLKLGTLDQASNTVSDPNARTVSIEISATDKLADIASKINGSNAGVTASILSDASGERLLLRSNATGEASGFQVIVDEGDGGTNTDDNGLSRLLTAQSVANPSGMVYTSYGKDAQATVNGLAVTSSSNTFENTVSGITFKANKLTTDAVNVSVTKDDSQTIENVKAFVTAYNEIETVLNDYTKYVKGVGKESGESGMFQGDSTITLLQNNLRNSLTAFTSASGVYARLSDVGLSLERSGSGVQLTLDEGKLSKALNDNPEEVKSLFRNPGTGTERGVAVQLRDMVKAMLGSDGLFKTKEGSFDKALERNADDQARVNLRVESVEARLVRQYSALDSKMATLNALSEYMTQQVTTWNNSKK